MSRDGDLALGSVARGRKAAQAGQDSKSRPAAWAGSEKPDDAQRRSPPDGAVSFDLETRALVQALRRLAPRWSPLEVLAKLEDRPWPSARQFAAELGVAASTAARILNVLHRTGAAREVRLVASRARQFECVVYLTAVLVDMGAAASFERELAVDPCVTSAVRVTGRYGYRIEATHPDLDAAKRWFQQLVSSPAIGAGDLRIVKALKTSQGHALALLDETERNRVVSSRGGV